MTCGRISDRGGRLGGGHFGSWFRGLGAFGRRDEGLDAEVQRADANLVARLERGGLLDGGVVEMRAVAATQISDVPLIVLAHDGAVSAANCRTACAKCALARSPDDELVFLQRDLRAFLRTGQHYEFQVHNRPALFRESKNRIKNCAHLARNESHRCGLDHGSDKATAAGG